MPHFLTHRLAAIGFAAGLFATAAIPAFADDFGQRFTIDIAPNYQASTTGDANAAPPPGNVGDRLHERSPGSEHAAIGLRARLQNRQAYPPVLRPLQLAVCDRPRPDDRAGLALVSGLIFDRTDTMGINHDFGHGFVGASTTTTTPHGRDRALPQSDNCAIGPGGTNVYNPRRSTSTATASASPTTSARKTRIGPLFTPASTPSTCRVRHVPRSRAERAKASDTTSAANGILPYSITMKLPISLADTFIPFIGYERAAVLFRAEATPEVFNVTNFGIVKVINKNLSLSIVNLNFSECRCSDTVPPPDNVRFRELLVKLDIKTCNGRSSSRAVAKGSMKNAPFPRGSLPRR
jgi:hypothetical protein